MSATKEQLVTHVPKRIKGLHFGISSPQDIVKQGVIQICDRHVYDSIAQGPHRRVTTNGPMDIRLGTSTKDILCGTCGQELKTCNGHFGYVQLSLPCFHIGYLRFVVDLLNSVCKKCAAILLKQDKRNDFVRSLRNSGSDNFSRAQMHKRIAAECKKQHECPKCLAVNGPIRKVAAHPLKILHLRFEHYLKSTSKSKKEPPQKTLFDSSFVDAKAFNPEVERNIRRVVEDLNPLRVYNLFRQISDADCELLGMDPRNGRPEMFLWTKVPAPPVCIRPSIKQEAATTEDDITNKLGDIVHVSNMIREHLNDKAQPLSAVMEHWEFLQIQLAMYVNSDVPNLNRDSSTKAVRGLAQRLKGKQGRFRGNLSGKRVDFSGRTVISPDPNLGIGEVAVPERVARILTYPERVSKYNIKELQTCIRNGSRHPGANYIVKADGGRSINLAALEDIDKRNAKKGKTTRRKEQAALELRIGDTVERHLRDNDIVLFNRQPSLHKLSILSHRVKVRPWRTFRLNECVCNPYNADFDGDEMNLHVPQTEEARTEATELMGVEHNLATPKNGTPIIAAIQDFITGAYLLSDKENFYDRRAFAQICNFMFIDATSKDPITGKPLALELPPPSIIKPQYLWTGKQVFNVLMRPSRDCPVLVNVDAECKGYARGHLQRSPEHPQDYAKDDNYLIVRNSEVMCGRMDKATVGDGKKNSVFSVIMRDFGPSYAAQAMSRLAKLSARWLTEQGFTLGLGDVTPTAELLKKKEASVSQAYNDCQDIILRWSKRKLGRDPGCNAEETMEGRVTGVLNAVRQATADACTGELSKHNAPMLMATAGSKGGMNNVSQMITSVGQQIIGGKRVVDGFQDRTLPHFPKSASKEPASKGFVKNSFYSGLNPAEFIFHAMAGREGLVDTAVKTAETGYMSRRLMKSLEDLCAHYDTTVRNSSDSIVQFQFGDDGLDPADMEGNAKPVAFDRTFIHAITSTWNNEEKALTERALNTALKHFFFSKRSRYPRKGLLGEELSYDDDRIVNTDEHESARNFYKDLESFVKQKARPRKLGNKHHIGKITESALQAFLDLCVAKYTKSMVQPGHAVGAVGAQSIGEPGTQMTLKTFHFAGVAGMTITQGVPRIKEIINASKAISTPIITCALSNRENPIAAQIVKGKIEKTFLRDIIHRLEECWQSQGVFICIKLRAATIRRMHLQIDAWDVMNAIAKTKALQISRSHIEARGQWIRIYLEDPTLDSWDLTEARFDLTSLEKPKRRGAATRSVNKGKHEYFYGYVQGVKRGIINVPIGGMPEASRCVIKRDDKRNVRGVEEMSLLVEGYGLKRCMTTEGVDGLHTVTNSVMEMRDVLGIEAARTTIIKEIHEVMKDMNIDPRHLQLLADVMTYKGDVYGITRFGLAKMRNSVLQLASFEKTADHLFDASWAMKRDGIDGVSECIIMGQSIRLGTGASRVVRKLAISPEDLTAATNLDLFEDAMAR